MAPVQKICGPSCFRIKRSDIRPAVPPGLAAHHGITRRLISNQRRNVCLPYHFHNSLNVFRASGADRSLRCGPSPSGYREWKLVYFLPKAELNALTRPYWKTFWAFLAAFGLFLTVLSALLARSAASRRRAEAETTFMNAELTAILNSSPEAVLFTDQQRRIRLVNPAFTELFGYGLAEVEGQTTQMLYDRPEDFETLARTQYTPEASSKPMLFELRLKHKDGSIFLSETISSFVRDDAGNLVGYASIVRDITEKKRLEKDIFDSENRLRAIVETAADGIMTVDLHGRVETANQAAEEMFAYGSGEMDGLYITELMPPNFAPSIKATSTC